MSPIPKANEPGNNPQSRKGEEEELEPPPQDYNSVLNAGDMSSEEEDSDEGGDASQYGGYQLLTQDPEQADDNREDDVEHSDEVTPVPTQEGATGNLDAMLEQDPPLAHSQHSSTDEPKDPSKPNLPSHLAKLLPSSAPVVDAASQVIHTDTRLTLEDRKEKMATDDQIRAAMAGISLPTAAIPTWARAVDEKDWKEQLVARIQHKHEKRTTRPGNSSQMKSASTKR